MNEVTPDNAEAVTAAPRAVFLSETDFARFMGLTTRQVRNLSIQGMPSEARLASTVYPVPAAVEWYINLRSKPVLDGAPIAAPDPGPPPVAPFYMLHMTGGGPPTARHYNERGAVQEAQRLARLKPGSEVVLLKAVRAFVHPDPVVEVPVRDVDQDLPF